MRIFASQLLRGRWFAIVTCLVPVISLLLVVAYGVDVPVADDWSFAPTFLEAAGGRVTLDTLLQQVNDSRPLFPRLLFLALSAPGRWNPRVSMVLQQLLVAANAGGFFWLWRRTRRPEDPGLGAAGLAVVIVLFSQVQYENFYWGVQILFQMPIACLIGSLMLIASRQSFGIVMAGVAALCTVATFSHANGAICWPLTGVAVLGMRDPAARRSTMAWTAWIGAALVNTAVYLHGYVGAGAAGPLDALRAPIDFALAYLAYLGSSLSYGEDRFVIGFSETRFAIAAVCGAAILAGLVAAAAYVRREAGLRRRAFPWLVLAAYSLGTGFAATLGRFMLGRTYMLSSRYVAFSAVGIASAIVLARLCLTDYARLQARDRPDTAAHARTAVTAVTAIVATLSLVASVDMLKTVRDTSAQRLQMQAVVQFIASTPESVKQDVFDTFAQAATLQAPRLQRAGYLRTPDGVTWAAASSTPVAGCLDGRKQEADGSWRLSGWTLLPNRDTPADAILVTAMGAPEGAFETSLQTPAGERIVSVAVPNRPRPDLRFARRLRYAPMAGWEIPFAPDTPLRTLRFWALDVRAQRVYPLCHAIPVS
jgi:hypothetical protein